MKAKALLFLNTHKAALISFASGFLLAVLIFVLIPSGTKEIDVLMGKLDQLNGQVLVQKSKLVQVETLKKEFDAKYAIQEKTIQDLRNQLTKIRNEKIPNYSNRSNSDLEKFFSDRYGKNK